MDWKKAAFQWDHARAFLVVAEAGSFSAAAKVLGTTQPTLGRQIAALEQELGIALFERVGHKLVLTPTGQDLVEHVQIMSDAATRFALVAAGQAQAIDGVVRLAASEAVAAFLLPSIIAELRQAYPGIHLELVVSNTSSDLRRREADIAIRHYRPRGDDLVVRQIKETSAAHLYATAQYLERIGNPRTPADLAKQGHVVAFDEYDRFKKGLQAIGLPFEDHNFPLRTDNSLVQWELAKQGVAMCVMMEEVGDKEPRLVRALPDFTNSITFPTWLTSHRELKTSRRMRVVFDFIAEKLKDVMHRPRTA